MCKKNQWFVRVVALFLVSGVVTNISNAQWWGTDALPGDTNIHTYRTRLGNWQYGTQLRNVTTPTLFENSGIIRDTRDGSIVAVNRTLEGGLFEKNETPGLTFVPDYDYYDDYYSEGGIGVYGGPIYYRDGVRQFWPKSGRILLDDYEQPVHFSDSVPDEQPQTFSTVSAHRQQPLPVVVVERVVRQEVSQPRSSMRSNERYATQSATGTRQSRSAPTRRVAAQDRVVREQAPNQLANQLSNQRPNQVPQQLSPQSPQQQNTFDANDLGQPPMFFPRQEPPQWFREQFNRGNIRNSQNPAFFNNAYPDYSYQTENWQPTTFIIPGVPRPVENSRRPITNSGDQPGNIGRFDNGDTTQLAADPMYDVDKKLEFALVSAPEITFLSPVRVRLEHGTATVTGTVASEKERQHAVEILSRQPGVHHVLNQLDTTGG